MVSDQLQNNTSGNSHTEGNFFQTIKTRFNILIVKFLDQERQNNSELGSDDCQQHIFEAGCSKGEYII